MTNHKSGHPAPFVLVILDGWGVAPPSKSNAITLADTPVLQQFQAEYPYTTLSASGEAVGLLPGQDGNSEAGHLNIGAGRVVPQDVVFINRSIADGTFFKNPAFEEAVQHAAQNRSHLHLMGILSDWHSAHANPEHLYALLDFTRRKGVKNVYVHLFTDGRDSSPYGARVFLDELLSRLKSSERIATIMGRLYLDRKKDWSRTDRAYHTLVSGEDALIARDPRVALEQAYARGETDEYVMPTVIVHDGPTAGRIKSGDAVIFFNLRSDRARQLSKPFAQTHFNKMNPGSFRRKKVLKNLVFVAMTDFGPDLGRVLTAFPSRDVKASLPMVLSEKVQYYIAESEKYAHMTYFFNGGYDHPVGGERRIPVASPHVPTYDQVPEMASRDILERALELLESEHPDFVAINFCNADMMGHTGNPGATIKGVETIDQCIGTIAHMVLAQKGTLLVTADHGNAEELFNEAEGSVDTEHSTNPVPFMLVSEELKDVRLREGGALCDVAPTILEIMDIPKPEEMTGKSLIMMN